MRHREIVALFQYWNALRGHRPAPRRTEIEPAQIRSILADTFILEKDGRNEAIFRLAGTRLCATYGRELKGYAFPLLFTARDQRTIARHAWTVFHENASILCAFEGESAAGRTLAFEMLLLPLEGAAGSSPRLLGAISPAERPYWFGADPIVENRIESLRRLDPELEAAALPLAPVAAAGAFMSGQPQYDSHRGRRIRHLVVFEGGRGG